MGWITAYDDQGQPYDYYDNPAPNPNLSSSQTSAYQAWVNAGALGPPPDMTPPAQAQATAQMQQQALQTLQQAGASNPSLLNAYDIHGNNTSVNTQAAQAQAQAAAQPKPQTAPGIPPVSAAPPVGTIPPSDPTAIGAGGIAGIGYGLPGGYGTPVNPDDIDTAGSSGGGNVWAGIKQVYNFPTNSPSTGSIGIGQGGSGVTVGGGPNGGGLTVTPGFGAGLPNFAGYGTGPGQMGPVGQLQGGLNAATAASTATNPGTTTSSGAQNRNIPAELQQILGQYNNFGAANYTNQGTYSPGLTAINTSNYNNALQAITPQMRSAWNAANPQQAGYAGQLGSLANTLMANAPGNVNTATYNPANATAPNQPATATSGFSAPAYGYQTVTPNTGFNSVNPASGDAGLTSAINRLGTSGPSPLQQTLEQQATSQLALGSSLDPSDQRAAQQAAREAWSARGLVNSPGSVGDEILNQYNLGQQRLQQRQAFAGTTDATNFAQQQQGFTNSLGVSNASQGYAGLGLQGQQANLSAQLAGNQLGYQGQAANQAAGLTTNQLGYNYAGLGVSNNQFNASQTNSLNQYYAGLGQANNQFNAGATNTAGQYNAGATNTANQFNAQLGLANNAAAFGYGTSIGNLLTQQQINPLSTAQGLVGQSPDYTNPLLAYGQDAFNTNTNAGYASNISQQNNTAAINAAQLKTIGSLFTNPNFLNLFGGG